MHAGQKGEAALSWSEGLPVVAVRFNMEGDFEMAQHAKTVEKNADLRQ